MLADTLLLLLLVLVLWLFWQGRRQAEYARSYALRYCQQQQLQFLDIAWQRGRLRKVGRRIGWYSVFQFAFSSDREHRYEGELELLNLQLLRVTTPVYRLPDA